MDALSFSSRADLEELQGAKLCRVLAEIYGRNQFYTDKLDRAKVKPDQIKSVRDLQRLPFTEKSELAANQERSPFAANLTYPLSRYTRFHQTSGTKGEPLHVLDTPESWEWWGRCWRQVFAASGVGPSDRVFCAFSFGPFIGFWAAVEGARQLGALLIPAGGRSSLERLKLMKETQSTALCCTPSYALHLLQVAHENDFSLDELKIHTTIHAGEPGANVPAVKRRIEKGWSARCCDHSGASEVGAYGFEARERPDGLFVNEAEFIAEVLDEQGEQVESGAKGELVLTNLGRWGFPVIRYRTGDIARYAAPAEDARHLLYLEGGILGRADDMITVRGVNVYPSAIDNLARSVEAIDEYRATVSRTESLDELSVEIETRPGADPAAARAALAELIKDKLGLRPQVKTLPAGSLPRFEMKGERFFINRH